jgi:IS5 family transposase
MKPRSAIKTDLFADEHHRKKIDSLGDPLADIESHIDFAALAAEVDRVAPRPVSAQGGRPPYPTETMVRILVLKRLYNLSDEQMEYQLLDRMSYKRFCGLANATNIPDRTTVWTFENRIGEAWREGALRRRLGAAAQEGLHRARRADHRRHLGARPQAAQQPGEKALIEQGAMPADWKPAKRRQKDTRRHLDEETRQEPLRLQALDQRRQEIQDHPPIETDTASTHDSQHFDNVFDTATRAGTSMPTGAIRPRSVKPG